MQIAKSKSTFLLAACLASACASDREQPASELGRIEARESAAPSSSSPAALVEAAPTPAASPLAPSATGTPTEAGDRIYAKARFAWIKRAPSSGNGWIGFLTLGGSVRLFEGSRQKAKAIGPGCDAWYRIEPMGYVCLGQETTLDANDPAFVTMKTHAGRDGDPFPFEYGESIGAPRYVELPTPEKQRDREWDLEAHLAKLAQARAAAATGNWAGIAEPYKSLDTKLAGVPFPGLPNVGPFAREARDRVIQGSTIAWSKTYDDERGRTWLYTSDHALVPKDRVKPYPKPTFSGVVLSADTKLPIAFFRKQDRPKYQKDGAAFVQTGASFKRLAWVMLTGESQTVDKKRYLETREPSTWVLESDAAVAALRREVPYRKDEVVDGKRSWVDVSVFGGTFVAYEGETPVFATLASPGRGGTPFPGRDPISTASTPTGTFRVDGKFRWASMVSSSDSNIVHAEVQYVQNFHGAHALHGAYWHDQWGELKSGGCVNLSPLDSKWVFEWSEPKLPDGWQGARSIKELGAATRVVVRQ